MTGFLGGTIAVNRRAEMPFVTNTPFGVSLGAFVWGGPRLRDPRIRALLRVSLRGKWARAEGASLR